MIITDEFLKRLEIVEYDVTLLVENENIRFYSCEINESISSVVIDVELNDSSLRMEGDCGTVSLRKGVNTFSIKVFKEHQLQMEYKLSIVVKKSLSSAALSAVEIDGDEAEPIYQDGEIGYYYYKTTKNQESVSIEAFPESPGIEISGDIGEQVIQAGINSFIIIVKSSDGTVRKNYSVTVENEKKLPLEEESFLNHNEPLEEVYEKESILTEDTLEGVSQLESLVVMGITADSGIEEASFTNLVATGELGKSFFKEQILSNEKAIALPLIPEFSPEITEYELYASNNTLAVFVAAYPFDSMDWVAGDAGYQTVIEGLNQFKILVMGESGNQQYNIFIHREKKEDDVPMDLSQEILSQVEILESSLSSIVIKDGKLEPEFSSKITEYQAILPPGISKLNITAIPTSLSCKVEGVGEHDLLVGDNTITLDVMAENEKDHTAYQIHYTYVVQSVEQGSNHIKVKKKKFNRFDLLFKTRKRNTGEKRLNEKKAVRTTKLIHRLLATIFFMGSAAYLLNSFVLQTVSNTYKERQNVQSIIRQKRGAIEENLKNRSQIESNISDYEQEVASFSNALPYVSSQEEILDFLNSLSKRIDFNYGIIGIGISKQITSADFISEITLKNMKNAVPNIATLVPPGQETPVPSGEGTDVVSQNQAVTQLLEQNSVTVAFSGKYEDLMRVYDSILEHPRIVITDNIQLLMLTKENVGIEDPAVNNQEWQFNMDLIFYQYTGVAEGLE